MPTYPSVIVLKSSLFLVRELILLIDYSYRAPLKN